jgi:hypothetical protein
MARKKKTYKKDRRKGERVPLHPKKTYFDIDSFSGELSEVIASLKGAEDELKELYPAYDFYGISVSVYDSYGDQCIDVDFYGIKYETEGEFNERIAKEAIQAEKARITRAKREKEKASQKEEADRALYEELKERYE